MSKYLLLFFLLLLPATAGSTTFRPENPDECANLAYIVFHAFPSNHKITLEEQEKAADTLEDKEDAEAVKALARKMYSTKEDVKTFTQKFYDSCIKHVSMI